MAPPFSRSLPVTTTSPRPCDDRHVTSGPAEPEPGPTAYPRVGPGSLRPTAPGRAQSIGCGYNQRDHPGPLPAHGRGLRRSGFQAILPNLIEELTAAVAEA